MHDVLRAGQTIAGYRLLRPIGRGASSVVFLAEDLATGGGVALKLVPLGAARGVRDPSMTDAGAAFMAAAQTARRLQHPGIVALWGVGIEGTVGWLAMEPVPGGDLSRYTRSQRLLPERLVLQLAHRLAQALGYAHAQAVVHRDLKPANVLVHWPTDTLKLADFGLSRTADAVQTGTGLVLGSPAYMAPEQLAGAVPTSRSDVYAFGVLLFELFTGRRPHEGESMGDLLRRVATEPAPSLDALCPALPPALVGLVADMLERDPGARPADGETVAARVGAIATAWPDARPGHHAAAGD